MFENITHPLDGMDQFRRGVAVDFPAEVIDMHIDDIAGGIKVVSPHLFQNHGPG